MDPQILNLINIFYLLAFTSLVSLAIVRIAGRYFKYKSENLPIPLLLKRDFFFLSGLTVPFFSLLIFRVFNISPVTASWYPFWVIGSGGLALLGTAYWVYIEYFKIEQ